MGHIYRAGIGIGSNLGDRYEWCSKGIQALGQLPQSELEKISGFYETEPLENLDQPCFVNLVALVCTELSPTDLLEKLLSIEKQLGRERLERFGPRTIDLDLLWYDDLVMQSPQLVLPHPRLHYRPFVLLPLLEIYPTWRHPAQGLNVSEMWEKISRC